MWAVAAPFLEKSLKGRTWLLGDRFSAADVVVGYDIGIAARLQAIGDYPAISAYMGHLAARPAFQKTFGGR